MKYVFMVIQIAILFILFWIGEWLSNILHLPIPGSVLGLLLLFVLLITGIIKEKHIQTGANFMMKHLVLFFIPATVGIMNHLELFKGKGSLLIIITVASTLMVMGVSGFISQKLKQQGEKEHA